MQGFVSRRSHSGERDYKGRITKAGDPMLRHALYEAVNSVLAQLKRPSALQDWGKRLVTSKGPKRARIAVARELAALRQDNSSYEAGGGARKRCGLKSGKAMSSHRHPLATKTIRFLNSAARCDPKEQKMHSGGRNYAG